MTSQQTRIDKALDLALAGATVLTPNTRSARNLRIEAEWRILSSRPVCATPDILPLSAWVQRTWTDCLLRGYTNAALLQPQVTAALWEKMISDSPAAQHLMSHAAAAREVQQAWELIHQFNLSRMRSDYTATAESVAFHGWATAYQTECRAKSWIDSVAALATLAAHPEWLSSAPKQIVMFGFDEFTPLHSDLLRALEAAGKQVLRMVPDVNSDPHHAKVATYADTTAELRAAANWARKKLQKNGRTRIGVLVPSLAGQRSHIETIFAECLNPERLWLSDPRPQRAYDISLGRVLGEHPTVRTALQLARLAVGGLPAREFSALLRSRYLSGGTSEQSERAAMDFELRKKLRSSVTIERLLKEDAQYARAPKFYRMLATLDRNGRKLRRKMTRSEFATELRRMLTMAEWPGNGVQEFVLSSEEFQVSQTWDSMLSDFGALDQVLAPRMSSELLLELERATRSETFSIANEGAPIQIVGPMAASGESFDALWMCGLTDEAWPPRNRANAFIPWMMQQAVQLPSASPEVDLDRARLTTGRVLQSAEECIFSWPQREEDRQLRPSSLLAGFAPAEPAEFEEHSQSWTDLQPPVRLECSRDDVAPPVTNNDVATHSTRLIEWQSGCPFRAYAQARLAAEPLDAPTFGADPRDRGIVTELALQYVWQEFRSLSDFRLLTEDLIGRGISSAVDKALAEKFPDIDEAWLPPHRELERIRLNALMHEWLDLERSRENFTDVVSQVEVNLTLGEVTIEGRADRIDQVDGKSVIIDYKTGGSKHSITWWTPPRPRDPQLPLYAVALQREGKELAGVAFARVRVGDCGFADEATGKTIFGKKTNDKKYGTFAETLESWGREVDQLGADFTSGRAAVDPKHPPQHNQSTCKRCHLHSLCRVAELAPPPMDEEEYGNGE